MLKRKNVTTVTVFFHAAAEMCRRVLKHCNSVPATLTSTSRNSNSETLSTILSEITAPGNPSDALCPLKMWPSACECELRDVEWQKVTRTELQCSSTGRQKCAV